MSSFKHCAAVVIDEKLNLLFCYVNWSDYASRSGKQNWPDRRGETAEKERAFGGLNLEGAYADRRASL
jgi:hypothetical protein